MDGTLVDSLSFWGEFWREFGTRYMGDPDYKYSDDVDKAIKTMIYSQGIKYIHKACGLTVSEKEFVEFSEYMVENFYKTKATVKEGAIELLEHIKSLGIPMCVASATDLKYVKVAIKSTGLEKYFDNVLSCEMVGKANEPETPRSVTPLLMLAAIILACSVEEIATEPPVVYPAGMVTEPALVEIEPPVAPLFAMPPSTSPFAPKPVLPVSTSADVIFASPV
jgi:hypothetical protein